MSPHASQSLHLEALPEITRKAFALCTSQKFFSSRAWYLAGGTALALHAGHRQSFDLDFFISEKSFNEKSLEEELSAISGWKTESLDHGTIYGTLQGAKISLIAYPFFTPAHPFVKSGTVSIISPSDIAAMKIIAVSQRGKKRDFVDLYWISKNVQPLGDTIESAQKQYSVQQNPSHILKSLVFFGDAEDDPMPPLFFKATWEEVKRYFEREVTLLAKQLLQLE